MSSAVADLLFAACAVAIAGAQALILRSTWRGMRRAARARPAWLEWSYAAVPALALALVLTLTWRAMHPTFVRFSAPTPAEGVRP